MKNETKLSALFARVLSGDKLDNLDTAQALRAERKPLGFTRPKSLLSLSNAKTMKGESLGYLTAILHLSPASKSGYNVCPKASIECMNPCLDTSGRGRFDSIQAARINKTRYYFEDREGFQNQLAEDISRIVRKAERLGLVPAIRLNGTSDLPSLGLHFARLFPSLRLYDYTKVLATLKRRDLPENYDLTFSFSGRNDSECQEALSLGFRVAICGESPEAIQKCLPWTRDFQIVSGDETDLRFLDARPCIVWLSPKGKAKKDFSRFVCRD